MNVLAGLGYDTWALVSGLVAGLACGFLNTVASSGSAVSLPILLMIGLDPVSANATNRVPVLIGALSATWSFHRRQALLWNLGLKVSVPVAIGALGGAILAEILPARDLALIITAAVLVALVLLFTKLKQAIEAANSDVVRYGLREFLVFVVIGAWLGFIVLDGATYLLLALTLIVGLPLIQANAIKSALLIPSTIIAMLVFGYKGNLNWTLGAVMGAGSIAGGVLGARLAMSSQARKWVFLLLVVVITAELVQLTIHYVFKTH
jgi:uncharacterized membrane protein YfcA